MSYHLRIKICGITNESDGRKAAHLGADAIGINFAPKSPRCVNVSVAQFILRELPTFVEPVGVFVNRPLRKIFEDAHRLGIRAVQWHGDSQNRELSDAFPFRLISAFQVRDSQSLVLINRYLDMARSLGQLPAALLVDGYAKGQHGGTGQSAPWELLAEFRPDDVPIILAGGLTPENVAEAVRIVQPYGVDVASGVESSPGQKDPNKMAHFIYNARLAASQLP